jgi:hypothetical protein
MASTKTGHGELRSDKKRNTGEICPPEWPCGKCGCKHVRVTSPTYWPIDSVAIICFMCGAVVDYADDLLIFKPKEALKEYVKRKWVVREGIALQPTSYEIAIELIRMGIEGGLTDEDIAYELNVTLEYVDAVATLIGAR